MKKLNTHYTSEIMKMVMTTNKYLFLSFIGIHDHSLYIDPKQILIVFEDKIHYANSKVE